VDGMGSDARLARKTIASATYELLLTAKPYTSASLVRFLPTVPMGHSNAEGTFERCLQQKRFGEAMQARGHGLKSIRKTTAAPKSESAFDPVLGKRDPD
jgi:hypothetical protein